MNETSGLWTIDPAGRGVPTGNAPPVNPVLEAIVARRSVGPRHLTGPDLTTNELDALARAAAAAPDHGRLRPVSLRHIPAEHRTALAEVFAEAASEAASEADPQADRATLNAARDRALAGPALIAVIARLTPDHPTVPLQDQWLAVGAALQALLMAAQSLGLHAKPLSGKRVRSLALRRAFALDPDSHLALFVALGRAQGPLRETPRPPATEILTRWAPPAGC